ncbi:MAG: hypothetical protein ACE5Q6_14675 [Dehalococcoidia bacterium]
MEQRYETKKDLHVALKKRNIQVTRRDMEGDGFLGYPLFLFGRGGLGAPSPAHTISEISILS